MNGTSWRDFFAFRREHSWGRPASPGRARSSYSVERKPPLERRAMDARLANAKRTIAPCTATIDTVTIDGVKGYSSECFTCLRRVKSKLEQCAVVCRSAEQNCSPGAHRAGVAGAGRPGVLVQYLFRPADAAPAAAVMPGHGTSERPAPFSPMGQKPLSKKASSSVYRRSEDGRRHAGSRLALGLHHLQRLRFSKHPEC